MKRPTIVTDVSTSIVAPLVTVEELSPSDRMVARFPPADTMNSRDDIVRVLLQNGLRFRPIGIEKKSRRIREMHYSGECKVFSKWLNSIPNVIYIFFAREDAEAMTISDNEFGVWTLRPQRALNIVDVMFEELSQDEGLKPVRGDSQFGDELVEEHDSASERFPMPDVPLEITAIEGLAAQLRDTSEKLRAMGMPISNVEATMMLSGLHQISEQSTNLAKAIALHAIERDVLSRVKAGEALGVHQNTVGNWYNARSTEQ